MNPTLAPKEVPQPASGRLETYSGEQSEPLSPCPFCGTAPVWRHQGNGHTKSRRLTIRCPNCRFERSDAAIYHDFAWLEQLSIKAWNTRAASGAPQEAPGAAPSDSQMLDWLEAKGHAYGFEDMHEGNRWTVEGPFQTVRAAISAAMKGPQ